MVSAYITYRNHPSLGLAQMLATELEKIRIRVYLSPQDKSGDYRIQYPFIEEADIFICVIAEGTFEPRWIQREIEYAHSLNKPMIPIHQAWSWSQSFFDSQPDSIQFLLEQERIVSSELQQSELIDGIAKRMYALIGREAGSQVLIPNQYIFLSYSRRDISLMNQIHDDLRQNQFGVWVDEEGLEPGTTAWERAISDAIRHAGCLVAVLSPDAEQSIWVGRELAMAEALNKRIFPILVRGTEQDAIPFRLMTHQWIDARNNYTSAIIKLIPIIRKHMGNN